VPNRSRRTIAQISGFAAVGLLAAAVSACSSDSSTSGAAAGSSSLPKTIQVVSINDQTGTTSFAGIPATQGEQVAIQDINSSHYLGDTVIQLNVEDSQSSAQTAAILAGQAVASRKYSAILGGILSAEAYAVGPIAQKGKLPVIFTQSGSDGVIVGDYTFRATAPFPGYYDVMGQYLQDKGVKTIALLYDSDVSSYVETAQLISSTWKQKYGISVVATKTVVSTTQDFTAPISALSSAKPQAVAKFLLGTANATALQQLRQAGFTGPVIATNSDSTGTIKGAGSAGADDAWPSDFSPAQTTPAAEKFIREYKAKYGSVPYNYAAEGYDAAWWLARAIKAAGGATPADIQAGLADIAKTGFTGVEGDLTFDGNDERIKSPIVVVWNGTSETVVKP
jgi:branched-chain amino acid transport system substrate-binding protein